MKESQKNQAKTKQTIKNPERALMPVASVRVWRHMWHLSYGVLLAFIVALQDDMNRFVINVGQSEDICHFRGLMLSTFFLASVF